MSRPFLVLLILLCSVANADERSQKKILLIGSKPDHPFATHMYEFDGKLLTACVNKNRSAVAEFVPAWPPSNEQLADVDAIAFYSSPAGSVLLADAHRDQFAKLMQKKVGFVAIHWGTGVGYDKVSEPAAHRELFQSWLGGWFRRPPCGIAIDRTDLRLVAKQHPIGHGWDEWKIHDEFYLDPVLHKQSQPVLEVTVNGKQHVVGWVFERADGGRSAGITLGHFHHNFAREGFRKILVNAILWSAGAEIPKEGANVEAEPISLALPKQAKTKTD